MSYKNPGHMLHPDVKRFKELTRARKYEQWEPPTNTTRRGKKLVVSADARFDPHEKSKTHDLWILAAHNFAESRKNAREARGFVKPEL